MIDVDGSEVPAFLIPAGQLDGELPPECGQVMFSTPSDPEVTAPTRTTGSRCTTRPRSGCQPPGRPGVCLDDRHRRPQVKPPGRLGLQDRADAIGVVEVRTRSIAKRMK